MGLLRTICWPTSPKARLLSQLAGLAGQVETLATRLGRHAEMCSYESISAGLQRLAATEAGQASSLRHLLLEHGASPRPSNAATREGSSNWERLGSDLALQVSLFRDLNSQLVEWERIDPAVVKRLREFAAREDESLTSLRDLALRCDPQALD